MKVTQKHIRVNANRRLTDVPTYGPPEEAFLIDVDTSEEFLVVGFISDGTIQWLGPKYVKLDLGNLV